MTPYDGFLLLTCFAAAFLIGSVPFAYVVVFASRRLDLTERGSGNVGAMNAYEVTGSRWIGISSGLLDALKGAVAVGLGTWMLGSEGAPPAHLPVAALAGVVAGHNVNPWLSLHTGHLEGGKGLAAAGGGLLVFQPLMVPAFAALYAVGIYAYGLWRGTRRIIAGNVVALILLPAAGYPLYGGEGVLVGGILALLALPKHWRQARRLLLEEDAPDGPAGRARGAGG